MITGYGMRYPDPHWTPANWPDFNELIRKAGEYDKKHGEPDCIDPEKDAWMKRIEARIAELESRR